MRAGAAAAFDAGATVERTPLKDIRQTMRAAVLAIVLAAWTLPGLAADRLTDNCNDGHRFSVAARAPADLRAELAALVANPASNPQLYEQIWRPKTFAQSFADWFLLVYEQAQDVQQIRTDVAANSLLKARGLSDTETSGLACQLTIPQRTVPITEYWNEITGHYFLSSSEDENRAIDNGHAGAGWHRTGETAMAFAADPCISANRVYRFYGAGPNSHFFTQNSAECGVLRRPGTGWLLEGPAFAAFDAFDGKCLSGSVWRLYNNGAARNDSNHRYVFREELIAVMQARGWTLEGVAMCL